MFSKNKALGWGENPAYIGTPGGGSGGAIYIDGKNDDVLIAGTVMDDNSARECGGAVFDVMDIGSGALTFNESHLRNDITGWCQTFPGIYYEIHRKDTVPATIKSTDSSPAGFSLAARRCAGDGPGSVECGADAGSGG